MTSDLRSKRIRRMKKIISTYHQYVASYMDVDYNADCQDKTFVLDMLYGIGIALEKESYCAADGFERFKAKIRELIE